MIARRSFLKSLVGIVASVALAQRAVISGLEIKHALPLKVESYMKTLAEYTAHIRKERLRAEYERIARQYPIVKV